MNLKEYFTVRSPLRNFIIFIIMMMCATLIKIGVLTSEKIHEGVAFNVYSWAFMLIILSIIILIGFMKLEGYFILPGVLVVLWAFLNNTVNLISVATKILVICVIVNLFILILEILNKTKETNKKCKKKKNK